MNSGWELHWLTHLLWLCVLYYSNINVVSSLTLYTSRRRSCCGSWNIPTWSRSWSVMRRTRRPQNTTCTSVTALWTTLCYFCRWVGKPRTPQGQDRTSLDWRGTAMPPLCQVPRFGWLPWEQGRLVWVFVRDAQRGQVWLAGVLEWWDLDGIYKKCHLVLCFWCIKIISSLWIIPLFTKGPNLS